MKAMKINLQAQRKTCIESNQNPEAKQTNRKTKSMGGLTYLIGPTAASAGQTDQIGQTARPAGQTAR